MIAVGLDDIKDIKLLESPLLLEFRRTMPTPNAYLVAVATTWQTENDRYRPIAITLTRNVRLTTGWSQKTDTYFYFWDNFGNSAPILTILSLLQGEIYSA